MRAAIEQFRINIGRVRHLGAIHRALKAHATPTLDISDILRAELVMAVSALDHYVHEISRLGMLEAYRGNRVRTPAFQRFSISLDSVLEGISMPASTNWLEEEIRTRHSYQSFQHPDKIAEAVRLVSEIQLWPEVANHLGMTVQDVKTKLNLIIDRRNKIAHEADINPTIAPTLPGNRWPIDETMVDESIDFIEQVAETIYILL